MSAIEASTVRIATMADSTLRLTLDIEPRFAQSAFALFGMAGTPVALAALQVATSEPEAPKGGELAKWCAIRCQEPDFQQWLNDEFRIAARHHAGQHISLDESAAQIIRTVLGIKSRAEIDTDPDVREAFNSLIRRRYMTRGTA
jgi:endogenous inhibitor of DNA gyrase (YacG/DUF329 family)